MVWGKGGGFYLPVAEEPEVWRGRGGGGGSGFWHWERGEGGGGSCWWGWGSGWGSVLREDGGWRLGGSDLDIYDTLGVFWRNFISVLWVLWTRHVDRSSYLYLFCLSSILPFNAQKSSGFSLHFLEWINILVCQQRVDWIDWMMKFFFYHEQERIREMYRQKRNTRLLLDIYIEKRQQRCPKM